MGDGAQIHIFQLTARRHTARQAGHGQALRAQGLPNDVGGGLAFGSEVGGQDDFAHRAIRSALQQLLQADLAGAEVEFYPFFCFFFAINELSLHFLRIAFLSY